VTDPFRGQLSRTRGCACQLSGERHERSPVDLRQQWRGHDDDVPAPRPIGPRPTKLNKAIFSRLYVDADDHTPTTGEHSLIEPYAGLVDGTGAQEPQTHLGGLLATALSGGCASKAAMVEVPGIEPGSSVALRGLLRAQSALPLLGSTGLANEPV
jgi:hypothetical protein